MIKQSKLPGQTKIKNKSGIARKQGAPSWALQDESPIPFTARFVEKPLNRFGLGEFRVLRRVNSQK